jgi:hypothetical protein
MATTTIFCPNCNNKLRVPDELMSQPVQCPKCAAMFTAPPPLGRAGELTMPAESERFRDRPPEREFQPALDDFSRREPNEWEDEQRPAPAFNRTKVTIPAIGLIATAVFHLLINAYQLIVSLMQPEQLRKKFQDAMAMAFGGAAPPINLDIVKLNIIFASLFVLLSLFQAIGGVAMMRMRGYSLAVIGAAVGMINCNTGCCLLSIPIGIWALIILMQSDVKANFT